MGNGHYDAGEECDGGVSSDDAHSRSSRSSSAQSAVRGADRVIDKDLKLERVNKTPDHTNRSTSVATMADLKTQTCEMDAVTDLASARKALRCELDALPDIVANASSVSFRHEIRTVRAPEAFCETPRDVMERTASLLNADIVDGVARTVHDTVTVAIGCNRVPLRLETLLPSPSSGLRTSG